MSQPRPDPRGLPAPPPPATTQALFLDVDGTLCPIMPRPAEVRLDGALLDRLALVSERLAGAVALVSGRPLAWLAAAVGAVPVALVGTHGLEVRRADGSVNMAPPHPGLPPAVAAARHFAAGRLGVLVEAKARGLALHYRQAPTRAAEVADFAAMLAGRFGLAVQPGNMVVELKAGSSDKGEALATLMAAPPFAGRTPVHVGDDLTDEAAFAMAERLGGHGVLVGPPRDSRARHGLADPAAVHDWLARLA